MKQQINEIKRMQQLAGIITESQLNEDESSSGIKPGDLVQLAKGHSDKRFHYKVSSIGNDGYADVEIQTGNDKGNVQKFPVKDLILFRKNFDLYPLQQGEFAGAKLLGHYILDSRSTPFQIIIDLAKAPDQKGKTTEEQKAFTIVYYPSDDKWVLNDSPVRPTPEDQKILDSIAKEFKPQN